jgi:hypothetical protein
MFGSLLFPRVLLCKDAEKRTGTADKTCNRKCMHDDDSVRVVVFCMVMQVTFGQRVEQQQLDGRTRFQLQHEFSLLRPRLNIACRRQLLQAKELRLRRRAIPTARPSVAGRRRLRAGDVQGRPVAAAGNNDVESAAGAHTR